MAILASQLVANVIVTGASAAEGQLLGVGGAADATTARFRSMAAVGAGLLVVGLVAAGAASAKMAADFQQAVVRLQTGAGDTQDSFATLSAGILKVSTDTGVLTPALSQAMYEILSSGQRGAQAFATLAAAAKGAQIEQANVVDVSDTLAGTMTNFGTKVFGASQYMNGLMTAVAAGRITLQDLSTSMGPIEPVAHAMGVSFADLAAAMSTQTNAAIPAARAATGLRFLMQSLEVPTKKASTAMTEWGLNTVAVANEMKVSLPGALQMIYDAALKAGPQGSVPFNRAVSDMIGGQRSLGAFLALTGTHMAAFSANATAIAASMKTGSGDVNGWALAQGNFNIILDKARAVVEALMINIGAKLLPVLGTMVGWFVSAAQYVGDFSSHANVLVPVLSAIGAILVALLVPAIWSFAAGVIAATWPVLAIGVAVGGLVAIFMHFYQTNAGFKTFIDNLVVGFKQVAGFVVANFIPALKEVGTWFETSVLPALKRVGEFLVSTFTPIWKQLGNLWTNQIVPTIKELWKDLQPLLPVLKVLAEVVGGVIVVAFIAAVKYVSMFIQALAGFLSGLVTAIGGMVQIFRGVVQVISGVIQFIVDLVTGHFDKLSGDLGKIWDGIKNIFGGAWKVIQGMFQATVGNLLGIIGKFAGDLAGLALQAGSNIVSGIAKGITDGLGKVKDAIGGVVTWISDHLPHSPAKVGPLRDLPRQAALISEQIAQGLLAGMPQVQAAMNAMLKPVSVGVTATGNYSALAYRGGTSGAPQIVVQSPDVYLDGVRLSRALMPHLTSAIRYNVSSGFGR